MVETSILLDTCKQLDFFQHIQTDAPDISKLWSDSETESYSIWNRSESLQNTTAIYSNTARYDRVNNWVNWKFTQFQITLREVTIVPYSNTGL